MIFLQNPKIKVFIVVIITTVIAISIGIVMKKLLTPPPKICSGDTHLDINTNKCVPNCQDGYKNDPITGECVINCPDGEVSSKSISGVTIPGKERCVLPCGSGYCDPETDKTLCQDNWCYEPNCKTTDDKASHCTPPLLCGTDTNGKKKTNLPSGSTLDEYGCYSYNTPVPPPTPVCPSAKPNLVKGLDAYSHEHLCCKTTDFFKYTKQGEPFCCPDENDTIIDRKCCPKDKQCPKDNPTYCLKDDEVCTDEGFCNKDNAIEQSGDYTGCCPFPTSNGECYNVCTYTGTSETGMAETCSTDADCNFKSGFKFDGITTAGGKCDSGTCKLYCGPADASTQGGISCLNDPNSNTSTCINTSSMCKLTQNSYDPNTNNGAYICNDDTVKPQMSYWKSKSGAPILTVSAGIETPETCTELSCLERMATQGLLGTTYNITNSGKQRTLPKVNGINTPNIKDSKCTATIECNKMKVLQNGKNTDWSAQAAPKENTAFVMNTVKPNVFNGSYYGDGLCNPGATPNSCKFLSNGKFSTYGTYDGVNLLGRKVSGEGCTPAVITNPGQTYNKEQTILCSVNIDRYNNISPNYYCTSWDACCGEGGLINSLDYNNCECLENASNSNGICEYNVASNSNGIIFDTNTQRASGWKKLTSTILNAAYLSLEKTLSSSWVEWKFQKNKMNIKYSRAVVVMSYNGKFIGFNDSQLLGTVPNNNPINFYYTYCDGKDLYPWGKIPLLKGHFRFGQGQDFQSWIHDLGIPVIIPKNNGNHAKRDLTWWNGDRLLTLVKVSNKWYLAGVECFYWRQGLTYGIQQNDGKIHYGVYNSSTSLFEFTSTDSNTATAIDINYVFSAVPNASTNTDDRFLSGTTTKTIIDQVSGNSTLTYSQLVGKIKSSVKS